MDSSNWLSYAAKEAAMSQPMNSTRFARATRDHLTMVHGVPADQIHHLDAEGLHDRHRQAHVRLDGLSLAASEHWMPPALHMFLPENAHTDSDTTQVLTAISAAADPAGALIEHLGKVHGRVVLPGTDPYEAHKNRHLDDGDGHAWTNDGLHGFLPPTPPASYDAPVYDGGRPVNLAATIERLSALDGDLTELRKYVDNVSGHLDQVSGRVTEMDATMAVVPTPPPSVDAHGVRQAQALLAESLLSLGAIDNSHFNHGRWPERGSERSVQVLRNLHRLMTLLDGLADVTNARAGEQTREPCNCPGGLGAVEGKPIMHEIACPQFQRGH